MGIEKISEGNESVSNSKDAETMTSVSQAEATLSGNAGADNVTSNAETSEANHSVEPSAPAENTPAGFEEFDLDDIEVVESKVFAH